MKANQFFRKDIFQGRTALITGSNRGIGKELVKTFASYKCNIVAHSRVRSEDFSHFIQRTREEFSVEIHEAYFDLTDSEKMNSIISELSKSIDINILINSAGILSVGNLFFMTPIKETKKVFDVNFFAVAELTQLVAKKMMKNKSGCILNISSVAGEDLSIGNSAYGTSKAALNALTVNLSKDLKKFGIRVNALSPSLTRTEMGLNKINEKQRLAFPEDDKLFRMVEPYEVANFAVFICSDAACYINGQIIRIDGGNPFNN